MAKRIDFFLPLYPRDFLASTLGWTASERGHYLTLLMVQWDRGSLPADLPSLERLSPGVGESWGLLDGKFPIGEDGQRRNRRLEEHRAKAEAVAEKRAKAGRAGANGRWNADASGDHGKRMANAFGTHGNRTANGCQPQPQPQPQGEEGEGARRRAPEAPPSPADGKMGKARSVDGKTWEMLREAWNAGAGAPWRSTRPPPEAIAALGDPGWLDVALEAIGRLPSCRYFSDPVDLSQFCGPGFADKVLGGRYDKRYRKGETDRPAPVGWSGDDAKRFEATQRRLAAGGK